MVIVQSFLILQQSKSQLLNSPLIQTNKITLQNYNKLLQCEKYLIFDLL